MPPQVRLSMAPAVRDETPTARGDPLNGRLMVARPPGSVQAIDGASAARASPAKPASSSAAQAGRMGRIDAVIGDS
ncbi:hypothetical protein ACRBEV_21360 [Methylobacterium phyllosphaerae]